MKILTWNINGIRTRPDIKEEIAALDADIICFQETKVTRDMLEEPVAVIDGYNSYFSFSRKKTGYSGVATYCRNTCTPVRAEEGLSGVLSNENSGAVGCYGNLGYFEKEELDSLDAEGRAVITQHTVRNPDGEEKELAIINVYVPRVDSERDDRKEYKLRFLTLMQTRAEELLKQGSYVIVLGDMNISHKEIDHCDPDSKDFSLRPDRQWLNRFLWADGQDTSLEIKDEHEVLQISTPETKGGQFIDSFRYFYPDKKDAYTCWCSMTSARTTNYGTRLDYILGDADFVKTCLTSCEQFPDVQGSDHCPVKAEFTIEAVTGKKPPPLCTKYMPEFAGKQSKLSSFFTKGSKPQQTGGSGDSGTQLSSSQSSDESKESQVPDKKRQLSGSSPQPVGKKPKLESKKSSDPGKQAKLMNFFRKKPSPGNSSINNVDPKSSSVNVSEPKTDTKVEIKNSVSDNGTEDSKETVLSKDQNSLGQKTSTGEKTSSSAWKGLLGGLGKPPLCKGHKEACVIRMVKKDGPNKFKQFYVCARGDGHSSNPEARCDHFEWLDKKKTKK